MTKRVPEIRFEGFTDDWEQRKFEEMLDKNDGVRRGPFGSALKKEIFVKNSDYVVYEQQNAIYDNYKTRYNITKEKFDELHKFSLKENDFIMSGAGTIGRISRVPKGIKKGVFNQALIRFRINNELTNPEYFLQFVRAENMQRKLTGANPGSAISNLVPMSEVKKWEVFVPIKAEQKKLGSFFEQLDDTIALHQRKLEQLQSMKDGFLQKMFPKDGEKEPEIRFYGFTDDWEQRKLGEVSEITKLAGFEFTKYIKYSDTGHIPAIRGLNVKNGNFVFNDVKYIDESDFSKLSRSKLFAGDIVFTYVGTIGEAAIIPENVTWYLAPNVSRIRTTELNPTFLLQLLINPVFRRKEIETWIATSSQPALSMENIRKFEMNIPSHKEQTKIGKFFNNLDKTIALHQRELELLKQTKKAFLQKMFV